MGCVLPVILAGGIGTRLWPLSRGSYPKQFSKLLGHNSLFEETVNRFADAASCEFLPPIIMTNEDFRFIVSQQLQNLGVEPMAIIIEPDIKNTAPAILAASLYASQEFPNANLLVCPSDHLIDDSEVFYDSIRSGFQQAKRGRLVTFGIPPTRAETGYGYLKCSKIPSNDAIEIESFIEKPSESVAEKMIKDKRFLWNSGIFMFAVQDILKAFNKHAPHLIAPTSESLEKADFDLDFIRLDSDSWNRNESISIDYAIFEKSKTLTAVPCSMVWSDLGSWESLWQMQMKNEDGVVLSENATAIDCKNSMLRADSNGQYIVGLGLDDIIAVASSDAVLVSKKSRSQEVKDLVAVLQKKNISQSTQSLRDHRPWGWFEVLAADSNFKVKRIFVEPMASLSLQSHKYRSEHWVVVKGKARTTIDSQIRILGKSESVYVPTGAVHRLENPGEEPMELIEIQTGTYLGEDDIVRYEDKYDRE